MAAACCPSEWRVIRAELATASVDYSFRFPQDCRMDRFSAVIQTGAIKPTRIATTTTQRRKRDHPQAGPLQGVHLDYIAGPRAVLPTIPTRADLCPWTKWRQSVPNPSTRSRPAASANVRKSRSRVRSGTPPSMQLWATSASPRRALRRFAITFARKAPALCQ